ncbi:unnamed protein product [Cunninghamella blakesleeana]
MASHNTDTAASMTNNEKTIHEITTTTAESINTIYDKSITIEKKDELSNIAEVESNKDFEKTLSNHQKDKLEITVEDPNDFEEKKYGWLVVLGAFMVQVTSFGTATSWGKINILITRKSLKEAIRTFY